MLNLTTNITSFETRPASEPEEQSITTPFRAGISATAVPEQHATTQPSLPVERASAGIPSTQQPRTRAEINRANARRSTGPRTADGKAISKLNSLKHGFCAQTLILPQEDQQAFETYSRNLAQDLRVEGDLEQTLAQNMAAAQYQIERARAVENNILQLGALEFAPQDTDNPEHVRHAIGLAASYKQNASTIDLLSRYTARHNREFLQSHARLREIQRDRLKQQARRQQERTARQASKYTVGRTARSDQANNQSNQQHKRDSGFVPQAGTSPFTDPANRHKTLREIAADNFRNEKNKAA